MWGAHGEGADSNLLMYIYIYFFAPSSTASVFKRWQKLDIINEGIINIFFPDHFQRTLSASNSFLVYIFCVSLYSLNAYRGLGASQCFQEDNLLNNIFWPFAI